MADGGEGRYLERLSEEPSVRKRRALVGYFGGTGEILGLGFGSFFFVFGCLFYVSVVRSRLLCELCGFITLCSNSHF
jgi:hypothetical protein